MLDFIGTVNIPFKLTFCKQRNIPLYIIYDVIEKKGFYNIHHNGLRGNYTD